MFNILTSNPLFGIMITIFAYQIGLYVSKRLNTPFTNQILIATIILITILYFFKIPYTNYQHGGDIVSLMIAPSLTAVGVSIYRQINILKRYILPIVIGCSVGAATSMLTIFLLANFFLQNNNIMRSMLPKSVTTPVAVELSELTFAIIPITVVAVVITGITGAVLGPTILRILHIENKVAKGTAFGVSSHAIGTSKAIELGEIEGTISAISIGVTAIATILIYIILF